MSTTAVLLVLLAFLIGCAVGAYLVARTLRLRAEGLRTELDDATARLGRTTTELAAAAAQRDLLQQHNRELTGKTSTDNDVLRALAPVAEKLTQVQRQVGLLERDRVEQYGQLARQLEESREADALLLSTTHSLAGALRSNSARGQWGEVQLRRVVEAAGMLSRVDFLEQVSFTAGDDGERARPDMVVQLPGDKQLVIDAKVPLSAFLAAQELAGSAEEPGDGDAAGYGARRSELLKQHSKALRAHIDALARKKYWEGAANSPELVICFIPVESVLSEALRADPELLDYAFSRSVALASPVSLLGILKGAAFSWRQAVLTDNARELFDLSKQLYERLGTMGGHVTRLGTSLKTSVERYNSFVGALESRVLPTARRIGAFDSASLDAVEAAVEGADGATGSSEGPAGADVSLLGAARAQRAGSPGASERAATIDATPRSLTAHELLEESAG
ncbi:DNA recombination protein RmuC [Arthrobacter agilis]|jgi:DNA recombination protein RmuC|uniref:DNA recombination protein RmuC n=1 Tax=Arthrobacter agilis TaxID=37921 RepID=UPI00277F314F|nr:DNA recombination protein RmuC [Arthrobacter agilis]MDQ0735645.1 DNA recombination protein RmuC [Arthrobacter agilis]